MNITATIQRSDFAPTVPLRIRIAAGIVALLCVLQILLVLLVIPRFREIYDDFGVTLPPLSKFVIGSQGLLIVLAALPPVIALVIAWKRRDRRTVALLLAAVALLSVAQSAGVLYALFRPVFFMGEEVSGGSSPR